MDKIILVVSLLGLSGCFYKPCKEVNVDQRIMPFAIRILEDQMKVGDHSCDCDSCLVRLDTKYDVYEVTLKGPNHLVINGDVVCLVWFRCVDKNSICKNEYNKWYEGNPDYKYASDHMWLRCDKSYPNDIFSLESPSK